MTKQAPCRPNAMTTLAFVLTSEGEALRSSPGTIAAFARKGGRLHRAAGNVFFVSMLVMAAFACFLAVTIPGQIGNLFGGAFAAYS